MTNGSSAAIGFVLGAAAGAGTAWYFTRRYWTTNTLQIANEMIEQRLAELEEAGIISYNKDDEEEESEEETDDDDDSHLSRFDSRSSLEDDKKKPKNMKKPAIDYSAMYNKKDPGDILAESEHPLDDGEYPSDISPEEEAYLDGERLNDEREGDIIVHKDKPYPITPDQYTSENPHYDKTAVYAYSDGVMAFENDEMIDNSRWLLGDVDEYSRFGNNTVYIRNDRMGADYEVMYVDATYQETVDGVIEPDWAD